MIRPKLSDKFDYEGELALVIGKAGRHINRPSAHSTTSPAIRSSSTAWVRDYQKFSVTSGKNWPGTGPLGPWLVTTDEIPDPGRLTLHHAAERRAGAALRHRQADLFDPADRLLLAPTSRRLSPGDMIATGTPEGVGHGRKPPLWMKPGDALEVEITGIGALRARITDEKK